MNEKQSKDTLVQHEHRPIITLGDKSILRKYVIADIDTKAIDEERRLVPALISMATPDRAGDRVKAIGWELENYRKNPVVLFAHDYAAPPIARSRETAVRGDALYSLNEFSDQPFALEIFDLYVMGFMSAWSVGFDPLEWKARYENVEGKGDVFVGYDFERQDLLEHSAVPVPMHPDALTINGAQADDRCVALARALRKGYFPIYREKLHLVADPSGTPLPADDRGILAEIDTAIALLRVQAELNAAIDAARE
jgi:hypothetical protein